MRRKHIALLALLALCLSLAVPALAAGESIAGYYAAESCVRDGTKYICDDDALILEKDGAGSVVIEGDIYPMTWELDGDSFTMEDEDGYPVDGVYAGGVIEITVAGYDYVYVFTGSIPVEDAEDGEAPDAAGDLGLLYCPAVSRGVDGETYSAKGDYLLLYHGGKGMVVSKGYAYFIDWTSNGDDLSFTDHMGETAEGIAEDDRVTAQYRGYEYVWEVSDEYAPITFLAPEHWDADLPNVFDQADILTDEQEARLGEQAAALTEQYHCKVYIITVDDMDNYTLSHDIDIFAEELMIGYHMGYGADLNAVILTLSMAERDYSLKAGGSVGNGAFTDYGREAMEDHFLDDFGDDDWYGGFSDYLKWCEKLLKAYDNGKPFEFNTDPAAIAFSIVVITVISFAVSFLICLILKFKMQSVKQKSEAGSYVPDGGFEVTFRNETFSHKTVSRVYDPPKERSSGGGGGGTTVGSSGHSSSSGKF